MPGIDTVDDLLERADARAYRLLVLQSHYRSPIEVTSDTVDQAVRTLSSLDALMRRSANLPAGAADAETLRGFRDFMDDDFNTGGAVGVLFELVTALNRVADQGKLEDPAAAEPRIRTDFLDYTVDRNPYKQGKRTPGTHIPIHPPEKIAETRPDVIVILPWNLAREISEQLAYTAEWGARLVVPIPRQGGVTDHANAVVTGNLQARLHRDTATMARLYAEPCGHRGSCGSRCPDDRGCLDRLLAQVDRSILNCRDPGSRAYLYAEFAECPDGAIGQVGREGSQHMVAGLHQ